MLTHYAYANLFYDQLTGRTVMVILHLVDKPPVDWYSNHRSIAETATYGYEFVSTHNCVEHIIDLWNTL